MEAYVLVNPGVTEARAFYNGSGGTPFETLTHGYGLGVHNGFYSAFVGGAIFMTVAVVPGQPVEMALVNRSVSGGTEFDLYVQRKLVLSIPNLVIVPPAATKYALNNVINGHHPERLLPVSWTKPGSSRSTRAPSTRIPIWERPRPRLPERPGRQLSWQRAFPRSPDEFGCLDAAASALGFRAFRPSRTPFGSSAGNRARAIARIDG
jgi:hypothetical protein